jgi:putative transposase
MERLIDLQPGRWYHLLTRGNNRENLFVEDQNFRYFLHLYARHMMPVAVTYAYCLLRNHLHLLVRIRTEEEFRRWETSRVFKTCEVSGGEVFTAEVSGSDAFAGQVCSAHHAAEHVAPFFAGPRARPARPYNPTQNMSNLCNAYAKAFNNRYGRVGSLFQERFPRVEITNDRYYRHLVHYIHTDPQRHGFVNDFRRWKWSSYRGYLTSEDACLDHAEALEWFGDVQAFRNFHTRGVHTMSLEGFALEQDH